MAIMSMSSVSAMTPQFGGTKKSLVLDSRHGNDDEMAHWLGNPTQRPFVKVFTKANQSEFESYWNSRFELMVDPALNVDFDKQAVVLVLLERSTAGSPCPELKNARYDQAANRLELNLSIDRASGMSAVMGNPWYLAVVDKNRVNNLPQATEV